jgi:hypothetical protein
VVDDLFTYEVVAEKVQGQAGDEQLEELVKHYKQVLVEHWAETAWRTIDDFRAHVDSLHPDVTPSPTPKNRDDLADRVEEAT